jgi:uncharacterized repeat protein (TIGR03803 family)
VFKINSLGQFTVLYSFTGAADGANPFAGVILDAQGNLYGTTKYGGPTGQIGCCGVVYRIAPAGTQTVLYSFSGGSSDGAAPYSGVVRDRSGNLYGTSYGNGTDACGLVYKIDTSGQEQILHTFTCGNDGGDPFGGVVFDLAGNLYGAAATSGIYGGGTLFKIQPTGRYRVLYSFGGY